MGDAAMRRKTLDEETIRKMEELTRRQKMLLSGLYDDLFGEGKQEKPSRSGRTERPLGADAKTRPAEPKSSYEDALMKASDALGEAKELFAEADAGRKAQEAAVQGPQTPAQEEVPAEPETDPMEDLNALIGLDKIKHDVKELTDFVKVQKMREDKGMKSVPVSLHLVFTGNPGTGKTTVARILARLYKQIGVLSKGQLIEVDRSGLVAGYVGQTALKTQEQIKKAMGGVLFIDEAYALAQKDDAFGQEAIDTILKAMEDHRKDLVVIVAGYTLPMEKFINSNPGLKSRFNKYIEFPDYTLDELEKIFYMNCDKYEYHVAEDVRVNIRAMIAARKLTKLENFANAREVRNLFEDIITNQARRVAAMEEPTIEQMTEILSDDLFDPQMQGEAKEPDSDTGKKEEPEKTGEKESSPVPEQNPSPEESAKKVPEENPDHISDEVSENASEDDQVFPD